MRFCRAVIFSQPPVEMIPNVGQFCILGLLPTVDNKIINRYKALNYNLSNAAWS